MVSMGVPFGFPTKQETEIRCQASQQLLRGLAGCRDLRISLGSLKWPAPSGYRRYIFFESVGIQKPFRCDLFWGLPFFPGTSIFGDPDNDGVSFGLPSKQLPGTLRKGRGQIGFRNPQFGFLMDSPHGMENVRTPAFNTHAKCFETNPEKAFPSFRHPTYGVVLF